MNSGMQREHHRKAANQISNEIWEQFSSDIRELGGE